MRIIRRILDTPCVEQGTVLAIGNFDGIHRGHQIVISKTCEIATRYCLPAAVLTFEPHPRTVIQPDVAPFRVSSLRSKARVAEAMGVEILVVVRFDLSFAAKSPKEFVYDVLLKGLRARHVIVGFDFVFGHQRAGDTNLLAQLTEKWGIGLTIIDPVKTSGVVFSSSQVRQLLSSGHPERAASQLGRWWEVEGHVRRGDERGAELGFPTANLDLGRYLQPALGIYAVRVAIENEALWRDAVAYIGPKPTFEGGEIVLEVHLFDFTGNLYGRRLRVQFVSYLRGDRAFESVEALRIQMGSDCEEGRKVLSAPAYREDRFKCPSKNISGEEASI